jgi:hypothetical protein
MEKYFLKTTSVAPLVVFRIALGLLLFAGLVRFWAKGWIDELYIQPKHFFPFYGFEFIKAPGEWIYVIFILCAISALAVAAGFFYRFSAVVLFLSFTYIELIDKSTYLNHYYFISMICLLMIFLPAHVLFSVDAWRNSRIAAKYVPAWTVDSVKLFVCIVYFFAGLAKLNSDWLLHAQPLRIWLPANNDLPLIGSLFNSIWIAYGFSWMGCLYDLAIPFLLLTASTRVLAYFAVIFFHVLTAILFPIGMFPYIMIATALIFFSAKFHEQIIARISRGLRISNSMLETTKVFVYRKVTTRFILGSLILFFVFHLLFPFRYLLYPGELFWTEEGYRFSWRVMLMEKAGSAQFTVKDKNGNFAVVDNKQFLTPLQEKMMATQPDMLLQFAHVLCDHYAKAGFESPEVYVDSYVSLNGRLGKPLVSPAINLAAQRESVFHKSWVMPFHDEIKGF